MLPPFAFLMPLCSTGSTSLCSVRTESAGEGLHLQSAVDHSGLRGIRLMQVNTAHEYI